MTGNGQRQNINIDTLQMAAGDVQYMFCIVLK